MRKRILSVFLALALCLTLLPTVVLAEEPAYTSLSSGSFINWDGSGEAPTEPYKKVLLSQYSYYLPTGHYRLTDNIDGINIEINGNVTLDLNGKRLTGSGKGFALIVGDSRTNGDLTIRDSGTGGGKVTNSYRAINVNTGSSLTLESGTVSSSDIAICINSGSTVTLKGGTVNATDADKAITFSHNETSKDAPTLYADGGTVNGVVANKRGIITHSTDVTTATAFTGTVENGGTIEWGTTTAL